jgi:hypothetical protein
VLTFEVRNDGIKLAPLINRNIYRDACGFTKLLVIFTVGRSLVDNSGSLVVGDVVAN